MRKVAILAVLVFATSGVAAQDLDKCGQTEAWFNRAIEGRLAGQSKAQLRRALRPDMGREAADQLIEFIFAAPKDQLSPAISAAARKQCEAL